MRTAKTDSLRLQVLQEVMELNDEQLIKLHSSLSALSSEEDNDTLYRLLHDSLDDVQEGGSSYSTKKVMDDIDKEMGWK